jgi:hypothetical protein
MNVYLIFADESIRFYQADCGLIVAEPVAETERNDLSKDAPVEVIDAQFDVAMEMLVRICDEVRGPG